MCWSGYNGKYQLKTYLARFSIENDLNRYSDSFEEKIPKKLLRDVDVLIFTI